MKGVAGILLSGILWSCSSETPFETDGQGIVRLRTVVNSITTRADDSESEAQQQLSDNCIVYISGSKGLIYKKQGLSNVDPQITLKAGAYVAEAWTGDSVTASFDKKFYRGYQPFEVTGGSSSNVVLNCRIRNVVASVNTATINPNLMNDDYRITIKNSGKEGELVFTKENAESAKGYFMMPKGDTALEYTIEGTRKDGKPFSKSGKIENVESAHHYILNFEYNPNGGSETETGAVFIKIIIKDEDLGENDSVDIYAKPTIAGVDFDIDKQRNYIDAANIPERTRVQVCAFGGLDEIVITTDAYALLGFSDRSFNVLKLDNPDSIACKEAGLTWSRSGLNEKNNVETAYVGFKKTMLEKLPTDSKTEYTISITAKDKAGKITTKSLRIVRNEEAIIVEDPVVADPIDNSDWENLKATSATIQFSLSDTYEGTPGIEYSKANEDNWTFVAANLPSKSPRLNRTRATVKYNVTLSGLEAGTTYKYRGCCGDFHSSDIQTFETYSKFIIPNAGMENWASVSGVGGATKPVRLPTRTGNLDFWGNGNPGAIMAGETLTDESTDMCHSSSRSARLESKFASVFGIGKFAAGNLFAGEYVKTDGTDGVLKFGQPFADFSDGKKVDVTPKALKVYVNYRPKVGVAKKGANSSYIGEGQTDQAQIYVALTTAAIDIRTKAKDQKLFNPEDKEVLAYGQCTLTENYGPDGQLKELIIPIEYFERSKGVLPTHLVIVCSASKYGDFFSGGEGSTMYLDDFELVY